MTLTVIQWVFYSHYKFMPLQLNTTGHDIAPDTYSCHSIEFSLLATKTQKLVAKLATKIMS